ncbi:substrate-binding domain-containing protein [Trebonia sp.]|uniref:substrate-binding domain-containing protein n=1 Tax=Trebonia sp. TaxID=2767075 RepID=UPI0026121C86|nr:substrate-binding domain-containing protein [Trebonia sp.]
MPARPDNAGDGRGQQPGTGRAGARLRLARKARGFSQAQLAGMARVSRQAVSAVEAGLSDPSLRVALALGRALGVTVEELFGPATPDPSVPVRALAPLGGKGTRVSLAPMGESFVALPLSGATATRAGFAPASGRVSGPQQVTPLRPHRPTLVVAGCDPALPLLELPLSLLDPPVEFLWWPCASWEALNLAAAGLVHVAGAHLRGQSGDYNSGPARELLRDGADMIGFCSWREGLVLRPELAAQVGDVADVVSAGLRLVNRKPGAEARCVLDRELARLGVSGPGLAGYDTTATGHLEVAAAIAAGLADAGVASEPAALAYGLAFVPLTAERFDLLIPAGQTGTREVQGLLRVLSSSWLLGQLAHLPGYDVTQCGERIASLPPT